METKKQVSQTAKCCHVMFLPNGNTAVFDENHEQIPELQRSWLLKFVEFLESKNIDVMNSTYEFKEGTAKLIRTEEGYNWKFNKN